MKCLVTGGAGFIGSHLCDRLIAEGHEIICIDNFITGSRNNIDHLLKNSQFQLLEYDCTKTLPENLKADLIFHFASPASPVKYQQYAIETLLVNTLGTYRLLERSRVWKVPFIFASTSEVYGDPLEHPQKETYWGNVNPIGPRSCYDEGKRAGEAFVTSYIRKYKIDARIIRIFNTYGPRMDLNDGRVVTNFVKQILNKSSLTINGDGSQTRSFCYISDLIDGIMSIFKSEKTRGEVLNLGNTYEISILELAKLIKKISQYNGNIEFSPLPEDDPTRRLPDISKVRTLTGWRPSVSFEEGLSRTLAYFKSQLKV